MTTQAKTSGRKLSGTSLSTRAAVLWPLEITVRTDATPGNLHDADIRPALLQALAQRYSACDALVINELNIAMGFSKLDVAVLNGHLDGYEIKSDRDSLVRLPRQMREYEQICDQLTIVTTQRYCASVEAILPDWCGIIIAAVSDGWLGLRMYRKPTQSPSWDVLALMLLLWQNETINFAHSFGFRAPRNMAKGLIHSQLARRIPHDVLREGVLHRLRQRTQWSDRQLGG